MMKEIELWGTLDNGKRCSVWACGICHRAAPSKDAAQTCCQPTICECGKKVEERYYTACSACRERHVRENDEARYNKAKKIQYEDYAGTGFFADGDDEFYPDLGSLEDAYQDREMPLWAWGTREEGLHINASDVIDNWLESEDCYEGAADNVTPELIKRLQEVLDEISVCVGPTYFCDYSTAVMLPPVNEQPKDEV